MRSLSPFLLNTKLRDSFYHIIIKNLWIYGYLGVNIKYYIETYGCSSNLEDSEIIRYSLNLKGFAEVENVEEADIIIINTCSVKHSTENKIVRRFKDIKERYKDKVLVGTGCLVEHDKSIIVDKVKDVSLFSINNLDEFF